MKRNQLVFIAIIATALVLAAVGVTLQGFLGGETQTVPRQTPTATVDTSTIVMRVAVNPLLHGWVTECAAQYQAANPRQGTRAVNVQVVMQESFAVWGESIPVWSPQNHPHLWLPLARYEVDYAKEVNLPFEVIKPSVGSSPLVWGIYESRAQVLSNHYGLLSTATLQNLAAGERWDAVGGAPQWGFVKMAFSRPDRTAVGLAALLTMAGGYDSQVGLSAELLNNSDLWKWLAPFVDSVSTFSTLGTDPGQAMATRGVSLAEVALLPESQWLMNFATLSRNEGVVLAYPESYILLDFPIALWSDSNSEETRAAQAFAEYLLLETQQRRLGDYGVRPQRDGDDLADYRAFTQSGLNITFKLSGQALTPPARPSVLALLRWFSGYRSAP
jgi:hypothetical protein